MRGKNSFRFTGKKIIDASRERFCHFNISANVRNKNIFYALVPIFFTFILEQTLFPNQPKGKHRFSTTVQWRRRKLFFHLLRELKESRHTWSLAYVVKKGRFWWDTLGRMHLLQVCLLCRSIFLHTCMQQQVFPNLGSRVIWWYKILYFSFILGWIFEIF